jgi:hypothetical protein
MIFNVLTEDNYLIFAIKNYDNPQSATYDDFEEDMKRFKYIKRLFKKYSNSNVLRTHLILNHLIILFNVFGEAATPLLLFKSEKQHWSCLKTFLLFLNRWPEGLMDDLQIDISIEEQLKSI